MKTETINERVMRKIIGFINTILSGLMICSACSTPCKNEITIYQGVYFKKNQSFELLIDSKIISSQKFKEESHSNDYVEIEKYCAKDSSKVKFTLDGRDTTFYLFPNRTKRLMIGSSIYGNFSIATDENKGAWIKM